jgi:hypothetical protein
MDLSHRLQHDECLLTSDTGSISLAMVYTIIVVGVPLIRRRCVLFPHPEDQLLLGRHGGSLLCHAVGCAVAWVMVAVQQNHYPLPNFPSSLVTMFCIPIPIPILILIDHCHETSVPFFLSAFFIGVFAGPRYLLFLSIRISVVYSEVAEVIF